MYKRVLGTMVLISGLALAGACGDDSSGDAGGGANSASFCDAAKQVSEVMAAGSGVADPTALFDQLPKLMDAYAAMGKSAPAEIDKEMGMMMEVLKPLIDSKDDLAKLADAMKEAGSDPAKLEAAMKDASGLMATMDSLEALDEGELEVAGKKVQDYAKKECGVTLES